MAKEEKKAPKLRFNGYTNDWERKKLGDVANSYINGGTPDTQNKNYWIGDIPWIQSSDLKNDDIWNVNINKYITNKAVNDSAAKLIPANSIAIVTRVGVGKLAYMSQEYSTSQDFLSLVDIKEDLIFIMYMLYFKISKVSSSLQGTSIKGITKKELLNLSISIVNNTAEQNRIGQVFKILDNSINLHERKYEELTLIKKALLQKLFPKKDGFKPEIRYKNFNDAWEQRKLGEVVERFDNLRIPVTSSKREKGITPYYGANGIQDYVQGYTHDGEFVLVAEDGANDLQNYPVHYVNGKVWVNNHAHVLQGKNKMVDNLFLVNAIKQIKIETYLVGGSRAKLNADVMMKLPIKVPTFNEQQRLGKYFARLDSLITLHQCKLEKLKQLKKFLLQNMFI
ncbi:restriction endonuclease subunit S [Ligilactobacillus salivarius]|uniref:Type I restriction-modification system specificity subunit n=2 Tax=Ligilactobacillus salivarius TaxID=1624 RepID=A0A0F7PY60_9LACO|nr:restriction endonuclease subunit S [Ligilactobacillus salivarius]AKI04415.1 type I restriction-modification system specificity subunit [Ligilactobacillus salivarius str. Ren]